MVQQLRAEMFHLSSHLFHFLLMEMVASSHFSSQRVEGSPIGEGFRQRSEEVDRVLLGLLLGLLRLWLLLGLHGRLLLLLLLLQLVLLRRRLKLLLLHLLLLRR